MAKNPNEKYLAKEISVACSIPKKFLEGIMLDLKKAEILKSKAGKGGGYLFAADPACVNLAEIIRLFDGTIAYLPCASLKLSSNCVECKDEQLCAIRHVLIATRQLTVNFLQSQTLESLLNREEQLSQMSTQ